MARLPRLRFGSARTLRSGTVVGAPVVPTGPSPALAGMASSTGFPPRADALDLSRRRSLRPVRRIGRPRSAWSLRGGIVPQLPLVPPPFGARTPHGPTNPCFARFAEVIEQQTGVACLQVECCPESAAVERAARPTSPNPRECSWSTTLLRAFGGAQGADSRPQFAARRFHQAHPWPAAYLHRVSWCRSRRLSRTLPWRRGLRRIVRGARPPYALQNRRSPIVGPHYRACR